MCFGLKLKFPTGEKVNVHLSRVENVVLLVGRDAFSIITLIRI